MGERIVRRANIGQRDACRDARSAFRGYRGPMESSTNRIAGRLVIESLVIVVSILAAFALDTWWDGIQERREERQTLEALRSEFSGARATIVSYRGYQKRIYVGVQSVGDSLEAAWARGSRSVAVPDTALALAYIPPTTSVALGTLEGLLASGRLGIIRDRRLRAALGSWGSELAELTEEETALRDLSYGDMDRTLRSRMSTAGLWSIADSMFSAPLDRTEPRPMRSIPVDTEVIGVFHLRRSLLKHAIEEFGPLIAEVDTILELIDQSL